MRVAASSLSAAMYGPICYGGILPHSLGTRNLEWVTARAHKHKAESRRLAFRFVVVARMLASYNFNSHTSALAPLAACPPKMTRRFAFAS